MPDNKLTDTEIKKALECCGEEDKCKECPYYNKGNFKCLNYKFFKDLLDLINRYETKIDELQELVNEMSDYFPACIGCEGKTESGERTDKCVYQIDNTNYCVKRGIDNIVAIKKENKEQKAEIERLKATVDSFTDIGKMCSEIKAEAYKECIEKVKEIDCSFYVEEYYLNGEIYSRFRTDVFNRVLDNLLKEMGVDGKEGET